MALAEQIAAALAGRELASADTAAAALRSRRRGPAFSTSGSTRRCGTRNCARSCAPAPLTATSTLGGGERVNVEYVSANPTGPMHVGHGRGAVVGDALAALLAKAGFAVQREYYINDAGAQVDALARSVYFRYREALRRGLIGAIPEGFYPGEYLKETGRALVERDGDKWLGKPRGRLARAGARFRGRRDAAADPRRSRRARRRASTRSSRSASWSPAARSMRR